MWDRKTMKPFGSIKLLERIEPLSSLEIMCIKNECIIIIISKEYRAPLWQHSCETAMQPFIGLYILMYTFLMKDVIENVNYVDFQKEM